jgi:signal transduction histidine kinase
MKTFFNKTYNDIVKTNITFADPVKVINVSSLLWIGYVIVLMVISQSFGNPRQANSEMLFYLMLGAVALLCLGLSIWSWLQKTLGRVFIPMMIALITILPITAAWLIMEQLSPIGGLDSQSLILRLLPFLLVGFLLVAWQYSWPYMLLIVLAVAALNAGIIWSFTVPNQTARPFFRGALVIPLIQSVVFLAVGFTISFLMSRLRKQQNSLESANVRLTHYSSTLEQLATTRERSRLARELHDTLAHTLSGLAVQLETVKAYWDVDHEMAHNSLEKSIETARSGLEETRRALKALRATPLDDMGLARAIENMVTTVASRANLALDLSIAEKIPGLSPDVEQAVYRIAQEAVTNTVNHAGAKKMKVRLDFVDGKLLMVITDDGTGFEVDKTHKSSHFGLTGMKERAQLIGGELSIESTSGKGTTVQLTV